MRGNSTRCLSSAATSMTSRGLFAEEHETTMTPPKVGRGKSDEVLRRKKKRQEDPCTHPCREWRQVTREDNHSLYSSIISRLKPHVNKERRLIKCLPRKKTPKADFSRVLSLLCLSSFFLLYSPPSFEMMGFACDYSWNIGHLSPRRKIFLGMGCLPEISFPSRHGSFVFQLRRHSC